jgi:hypothetical protein
MKRALIVAIVLLWLTTEGTAHDVFSDMTANDAIDGYHNNDLRAIIYVFGIATGLSYANAELQVSKERQLYCGPTGFDTGQIFGILAGFVAKDPAFGQVRVGNTLVEAFADAFPCKY